MLHGVPNDHRLYWTGGIIQDVQLRRRCGRTHSTGAVAWQICACRSDSGFLRRSPRVALHSRHRATGRSARVFNAGRRSISQHAEHDFAIALLFGTVGLARVLMRRSGRDDHFGQSHDRSGTSRGSQADSRIGLVSASLAGGLLSLHSFSGVSAADAVPGFIHLGWRARIVAAVVGRKLPNRQEYRRRQARRAVAECDEPGIGGRIHCTASGRAGRSRLLFAERPPPEIDRDLRHGKAGHSRQGVSGNSPCEFKGATDAGHRTLSGTGAIPRS